MKIAFTTLACPKWELPQVLRCAKENGYDGVDFRGYLGRMDICDLPILTTDLSKTVKMFADAGLEIAALSSSAVMHSPAKEPEQLADVRKYCETAGRAGAKVVRVFGGGLEGATLAQAIPRAVEQLKRMSDAAEPHGVTLAVETHDAWMATAPLAEVMERTNRPNVGALWDVHHPLQIVGEPLEESARNIVKWTRYTHFKDSIKVPGSKEGYRYVLPGEGQVPFDRIVKLLADGGYDGYLTVEWEKAWHPEIAEPEVAIPAHAKALRSAMEKAKR